MILIVKRKDTGDIHRVTQYNSSEGIALIWADGWPGIHKIGEDCDWEELSEEESRMVLFIWDNPEMTIRRLKKELGVSFWPLYRLIKRLRLKVKAERHRGPEKTKKFPKKRA